MIGRVNDVTKLDAGRWQREAIHCYLWRRGPSIDSCSGCCQHAPGGFRFVSSKQTIAKWC
ncbi:hypothetical protein I7I50_03819 [Histoplasma capsulatum G186AR]|uniref:Uncharacterized protein n=1 Tax=Ajellomyces capsulatus TaxID=5037 RepID=A0A8H7YJB8_AJECA|nr:hypothetical protein I7I52_04727 [Histoplasma capsulatum]QSS74875.1 hypothetical protein I7I50_03819 [Histoplasma capsulatum G186AR]